MAILEDIRQSNCSHDILHSLLIKEDDKQQIYEQHEEVLGEHCEAFVNQFLFDEYSNEEEEISTSPCLEIYSDDPIYDTYEFKSWEDHKEDDAQPILIAKELSPFRELMTNKTSMSLYLRSMHSSYRDIVLKKKF